MVNFPSPLNLLAMPLPMDSSAANVFSENIRRKAGVDISFLPDGLDHCLVKGPSASFRVEGSHLYSSFTIQRHKFG